MWSYDFHGLVGPTHNYAGLSLGNLASAANINQVARPRQAALQGLDKIWTLFALCGGQGIFPPPPRPATEPLRAIGFSGTEDQVLAAAASDEPELFRAACAASSMWAANAATVIAAPDSGDGRIHLVTANLASMLHRSFEATETASLLAEAFFNRERFMVHAPLPHSRHFGDEGAANHMRLTRRHDIRGVNIFVHGAERDGRYPERQAGRASRAIARMTGLDPDMTLFAVQSPAAVQAGAFHNDVVAVSNEKVLLACANAFEDGPGLFEAIHRRLPNAHLIEIDLSLEDAVASYLFNSELVNTPDGQMALIAPTETRDHPAALAAVERVLAGDNPVSQAVFVDVRESMRNGGGPACLRLRVPMSPPDLGLVDRRFLLSPRYYEALRRLVETRWPESVAPADLTDPAFWNAAWGATTALHALMADYR